MKKITLFLALGSLLSLASAHVFAQGRWSEGPTIHSLKNTTEFTSCEVNGKIYAFGGLYSNVDDQENENNGRRTWELVIFDPATNTWSDGPHMPTPRNYLTASVVNGKIYAIGGEDDNNDALDKVEIFDPATNSWSTGPSMPTARYALTSCVVNGKIYAIGGEHNYMGIGGEDKYKRLDTVEIFDPATNSWSAGPSLPIARADLQASVVNGMIYAIGGTAGDYGGVVDTVEIFDPATNSWSAGPSMPAGEANSVSSASVVNGKIYDIGSVVAIFDPATNKWEDGPQLPPLHGCVSSSAINDKIYSLGGGYDIDTGTLEILTTNSRHGRH